MSKRRAQFLLALVLLTAACSGSPAATSAGSGASTSTPATGAAPPATTVAVQPGTTGPGSTGTQAAASGENPCPAGNGVAWSEAATADLTEVAPGIRMAVYPLPDYEGRLWSQWGQGVVLEDGRILSAVGDHDGTGGNSFFYELDPASGRLTQVGDVLSAAPLPDGEGGYGKVHAQMVTGPCGEVYAATYWGSRRDLAYGDTYTGDVLLRLDPAGRTTESLGVPAPGHGLPSMAGSTASGQLYLEAADPFTSERNSGPFVVAAMGSGEVEMTHEDENHEGFRSIAVDATGRAYYSTGSGRLAIYDPATGSVTESQATIPGPSIRAATPPAPDGTVYGVTDEPAELFAISPDGTVRSLGSAADYTASLGLSPDGGTIYYVPGAHGNSWEQGTPLVAVDTASGEQRTMVELNPLTEQAFGLTAGGTYDIAVDPQSGRIFIGLNAAPPGEREAFGQVVAVLVEP